MNTYPELGFKEQKDCPVCLRGSLLVEECFTIDQHSDKKVELRKCYSCYHLWHNPLPTQKVLSNWYATSNEFVVPKRYESNIHASENSLNAVDVWEKTYASAMYYSEKLRLAEKKFNYLELGVGSGGMFHFFEERASLAFGVEPGSWREQKDAHIVPDISKIPKGLRFDLIVAHDVLEHLEDPKKMLSELRKLLSPEGIIHATFPRGSSLKALLQKSSWHMVRPFGHLHYFSKRSLQQTLKDTGLIAVDVKKCRISEHTALDLIRKFDYKGQRLVFRLIKSLLIGQIMLGKDQWRIIAKKKERLS